MEYTGKNLYLKFGSTVLSSDFRNFSAAETMDVVDASAGSDAARTYLTTLEDGTASLELVDQTGGSVLWAAVKKGTGGTLEWGPEGTAGGKPKHTCYAIVTNRERSMPYADVVVLSVSFQFSGEVADAAY